MSGALQATFQNQRSFGTVPGAPTIGTATISGTTASVPFTAPASDGGSVITSYTATSTPGSITGTLSQAGSGTVTVSGLTGGTSYTFKVKATNAIGTGAESAASNSVTAQVVGQQQYTAIGCYCWLAPAGVTKVSVVVIGGGGGPGYAGYCNCPCYGVFYFGAGGGGGASLAYKNNITVTPGQYYPVRAGYGGGNNSPGQSSTFCAPSVTGRPGGQGGGYAGGTGGALYCGLSGGNGGNGGGAGSGCGSRSAGGGGGGASGYTGNGGGGGAYGVGAVGAGGGGGGGGSNSNVAGIGKPGGGVGIFGAGSNGAGGGQNQPGCPGSSGSGKLYGGGGGGGYGQGSNSYCRVDGGSGAVRIIWPGCSRSFPSTNTGNM